MSLRLLGGKGGFGALLRGSSTRVGQKKTSNFSACRDLSGRRLRHVEEERVMREVAAAAATARSSNAEEKKIQAEFRAIRDGKHKKPMCKFGDECKYRDTCRLRHPSSSANGQRRVVGKGEALSDSFGDEFQPIPDVGVSPDSMKEAMLRGLEARRRKRMISREERTPSPRDKHDTTVAGAGADAGTTEKVPSPSSSSVQKPPTKRRKLTMKQVAKPQQQQQFDAVDLSGYESASSLQPLGMEHLKAELTRVGLKCGGTLVQRCERLFLLKNSSYAALPNKVKKQKPR